LNAENNSREYLLEYAVLAFVAVFMASVFWSDARSSWAYDFAEGSVGDNYFIANTAKNLSQGRGWGLDSGYGFIPFEREISTGATVFAPVAVFMLFVDDPDDARFAGSIFIHLLAYIFLLMRLRNFFPCRKSYLSFVVTFSLLLLPFMRAQWYLVLGEVTASCLLLISATYLAQAAEEKRKIFLSGLFAGAALMTKLITLLCILWLGFALLLFVVCNRFNKESRLNFLMQWAAGFVLVPCAIALWHLIGLGTGLTGLWEYALDYLGYYFGIGVAHKFDSMVCLGTECWGANFESATNSWHHQYGSVFAALCLLAPLLLLQQLWQFWFHKKENALLLLALGMCCAHLLFFYVNGIHAQSRYYFIGGFIGLFWLGFLIAISIFKVPGKLGQNVFVAVCIAVLGVLSMPWSRSAETSDNWRYYQSARAVGEFLNENKEVEPVFRFGFKDHNIFSYYLDKHVVWYDLLGFVFENMEVDQESFYRDYPSAPQDLLEWETVELVQYFAKQEIEKGRPLKLRWKDKRMHNLLQDGWQQNNLPTEVCQRKLYSNEHYTILRCAPGELNPVIFNPFVKGIIELVD